MRARHDPAQFHDVFFRDFVADPVATIGGFYDFAGVPFTPETEKTMRDYLATNRSDRYGKFTYSTDILPRIDRIHDADLLIGLYDTWVITQEAIEGPRHVAWWTPIDHDPVTPAVAQWAQTHPTIAMSRFGQKALAAAGIDSVYIPHGIEAVYQPTPSDVRARLGVPEDAFLVMMNAANTKAPHLDRKGWQQNLRAFAIAHAHILETHDYIIGRSHTTRVADRYKDRKMRLFTGGSMPRLRASVQPWPR